MAISSSQPRDPGSDEPSDPYITQILPTTCMCLITMQDILWMCNENYVWSSSENFPEGPSPKGYYCWNTHARVCLECLLGKLPSLLTRMLGKHVLKLLSLHTALLFLFPSSFPFFFLFFLIQAPFSGEGRKVQEGGNTCFIWLYSRNKYNIVKQLRVV